MYIICTLYYNYVARTHTSSLLLNQCDTVTVNIIVISFFRYFILPSLILHSLVDYYIPNQFQWFINLSHIIFTCSSSWVIHPTFLGILDYHLTHPQLIIIRQYYSIYPSCILLFCGMCMCMCLCIVHIHPQQLLHAYSRSSKSCVFYSNSKI